MDSMINQSKLVCVLSLFHMHIISKYWFLSSMYLHNWLIRVHSSWSSTYMKKMNNVTDWISQTTDISKYFVWSPGLWDKESCLYITKHNTRWQIGTVMWIILEPCHLFLPYANNKGTDQPVHLCSLISTFVVRCLDSTISLISISKIFKPLASFCG